MGPRASATIMGPAVAAGALCGLPGSMVGLAVGATAYGCSDRSQRLCLPYWRTAFARMFNVIGRTGVPFWSASMLAIRSDPRSVEKSLECQVPKWHLGSIQQSMAA